MTHVFVGEAMFLRTKQKRNLPGMPAHQTSAQL